MDGWVWSNGGMILTGENWSTVRKTLYSVGGRWVDECGAMEEWYWQGKTEALGEKHYTVWVVDGWMSMEQWWNDTDRGKPRYCARLGSNGAAAVRGGRRTAWAMALSLEAKCKTAFVPERPDTRNNIAVFEGAPGFVYFTVW